MGVAGWRFANVKRTLRVRAVLVGLLEELPVCLPGGSRNRLDSHDRNQALQGFAAVRRSER